MSSSSKDLMGRRRDKQAHQLALIGEALAAGRSVVVDNVNATVADRAALIEMAARHGAPSPAGSSRPTWASASPNRERIGRARVPNVAIAAAAKRWQRPTLGEGFDRLLEVRAEANRFDVAESGAPAPAAEHTVFLLSPASTSGERGAILLDDRRAASAMAQSLRTPDGVPLGEVYSFLSSLYFRGKLAYATAFARPPAGLCRRSSSRRARASATRRSASGSTACAATTRCGSSWTNRAISGRSGGTPARSRSSPGSALGSSCSEASRARATSSRSSRSSASGSCSRRTSSGAAT
jgi:hypothetical protein